MDEFVQYESYAIAINITRRSVNTMTRSVHIVPSKDALNREEHSEANHQTASTRADDGGLGLI
jgi:hypothetical protein